MKVHVRGRHLKVTKEMENYAADRIGKLDRYFAGVQQADVLLAVESVIHHAEISVQLGQGARLFGKADAEDMYAAIDLAGSKLEKQIRRFHARLKAHRDRTRISGEDQSAPGSAEEEATYERLVREMLDHEES